MHQESTKNFVDNPDFHLLLGIHAGDGYLEKYKWRFADNSKEAAEKVAGFIGNVFEFPARVYKDKRNNCWYAEVTRRKFSEAIANAGFPYGNKAGILKIPQITKKSILFLKSFLNGVFGCEATIYKKYYKQRTKNYPIIRLVMCDKNFIKEIAHYLIFLGLSINMYSTKPFKNSFSNKRRHAITLFGSNVKKFYEEIGLWHPLKTPQLLSSGRIGEVTAHQTKDQ